MLIAWPVGAGMRYRSRRDLLEIATNPAFAGRHEFKVAAIPGSVFGLPDCHIRIAYGALQQETASAGMARLVEGLHHIIKS